MPTGVPASAVAEASDVPNENLIRAEVMAIGAPRRRVSDPLPRRGLYRLAQLAKSDEIAERVHHGQIDKIGQCRVA